MPEYFGPASSFQTERLLIKGIDFFSSGEAQDLLKNNVLKIMSPKVTKSLPPGWQNINSLEQADNWLNEQREECCFFIIQSKNNHKIIGFLFLYESPVLSASIDIRVGYLLSEEYWGKGLASELIGALITRCESLGTINSIIGGVEPENKGSIRVLEKSGFTIDNETNEGSLCYVYTFPNINSPAGNQVKESE